MSTPAVATVSEEEIRVALDTATAELQSDPHVAARLQALRATADDRGYTSLSGEIAYLQARAHLIEGDLGQALSMIDLARETWLRCGEEQRAARTDLGRMNVLDDLGRHREAIQVGHQLLVRLDSWQAIEPPAELELWMRAAALENMGVAHGYLGDHQAALDSYEAAEEAYTRCGAAEDWSRTAANRGVELLGLGRIDEAVTTLRGAAVEFSEQGNDVFVAKCLAYEAQAQLAAGDYTACTVATERASDLLRGLEAGPDFARAQLVRAATLASLNMLNDAHDIYEELAELLLTAGLDHDLAHAHLGRARVLDRLGRTRDAITSYLSAIETYGAVDDEAFVSLSKIELSRLDPEMIMHRDVIQLTDSLAAAEKPIVYGEALLRRAELEDQQASFATLEQVRNLIDEHGLAHLRWRERLETGRRLQSAGSTTAAIQAFTDGLAAVEDLRQTIAGTAERVPFMADREQLHQCLVTALLLDGRIAQAAAATEHIRARSLVEQMRGEVAATALRRERTERDELYSQLLTAPGSNASTLRLRARSLERGPAATDAPVVADPTPSARLLEGRTVVTYQFLERELVAFVQDRGDLRVVRDLMAPNALMKALSRLQAQWVRFADRGLAARQHSHLVASVTDLLQQLHLGLVGPLDILDAQSLTVVPQGLLGHVPFTALHDGTCHLIERMPVSIAPSQQVASTALTRARSGGRRLILAIDDEATPAIAVEHNALARLNDSIAFRGEAATSTALFDNAPAADIIHIATHGLSRPDNPLFSALRLGDGWLTAADIACASLDGQLVVLSTCSSGRQYGAGAGEEVDGLPRAFLAAGASGVVVNLWPADDAAALQTMVAFHDRLRTEAPADALRHAQLTTMQTRPHPYHWAPATLIGAPLDHRPVTLDRPRKDL